MCSSPFCSGGVWFLWSTELSGNLQFEQPLPYSPKRSACIPDYRRDRRCCQSLSNSHNIFTRALVGYRDRLPRLIALLTMALLEVTVCYYDNKHHIICDPTRSTYCVHGESNQNHCLVFLQLDVCLSQNLKFGKWATSKSTVLLFPTNSYFIPIPFPSTLLLLLSLLIPTSHSLPTSLSPLTIPTLFHISLHPFSLVCPSPRPFPFPSPSDNSFLTISSLLILSITTAHRMSFV